VLRGHLQLSKLLFFENWPAANSSLKMYQMEAGNFPFELYSRTRRLPGNLKEFKATKDPNLTKSMFGFNFFVKVNIR